MQARKKVHGEYYAVIPHLTLQQVSRQQMAAILGMSTRSFSDKIFGYSHFSLDDAQKMSAVLNCSQDELFFDQKCTQCGTRHPVRKENECADT